MGVIIAVLLVAALFILITVTRNLYVCSPSEVLIFSGRRWKSPDGKDLGFRVVRGGRGMRVPLFEVVDRMQLTNMAIELAVQGAYSKGGVPLNVIAEAGAQLKTWNARLEQVRRKLEADVVAPADAERQRMEAWAKGQASQVVAQGRAAAAAVTALAEAYKASGVRGRDALLLQKLVPVFEHLTSTLRDIKVDRLVVLGSNSGSSGGSALKSIIPVPSTSPIGTLVNGVQLPSGRRSKYSVVPSAARRELIRS